MDIYDISMASDHPSPCTECLATSLGYNNEGWMIVICRTAYGRESRPRGRIRNFCVQRRLAISAPWIEQHEKYQPLSAACPCERETPNKLIHIHTKQPGLPHSPVIVSRVGSLGTKWEPCTSPLTAIPARLRQSMKPDQAALVRALPLQAVSRYYQSSTITVEA